MADIRTRIADDGSKIHQVRFKDYSNKSGYGYKSFSRAGAAKAFEAQKTLDELNDEPTKVSDLSMNDAVEYWLNICEKEGLDGSNSVTTCTLKNYIYRVSFITNYSWPKPINKLSAPDIVDFRSWMLNEGHSRDLCGKVLTTLNSIFKEMTLRGRVASNVAMGINIKNKSRYKEDIVIPTKEEVAKLLWAADELSQSNHKHIAKAWQRYRPILYLAVDSGMRPQEYLAVSMSDLTEEGVFIKRAIEGDNRTISVTKTRAGKRFIELSPQTIAMVREYGRAHGVENDWDLVFPSMNGKWINRQKWQRCGFNTACRKAGLILPETNSSGLSKPKYRPYHLRHFYASMLFAKKENLKKIQTLMGHTKIETTLNFYGHLLEDEEMAPNKRGILSDVV